MPDGCGCNSIRAATVYGYSASSSVEARGFIHHSGLWLYRDLYIHDGTEGKPMDVLTYSDARAKLKDVMDRVVEDRTQIVITRQKAEAVVLVSLKDWNAMEETMHLLSTPRNAERLRSSIRQLEAGKGAERDLIEP
jgi:antitoxin YefM